MRTEMHDAVPHSVRLVNERKIAFTFDLTVPENANMRDQNVVSRSMGQFLLAYSDFEFYSVEYLGDWMVLTCTGNITLPERA